MVRSLPRLFVALALLLSIPACEGGSDLYDFDGDGSPDSEDCAPEDAEVRPGAQDPIDGVDQDCDGVDGHDGDGDGYAADVAVPVEQRDCNDSDPSAFPGAADTVDAEGRDTNCDGVDGIDGDGDGFASQGSGGLDCDDADPELSAPQDRDGDGSTDCAGDCDDFDPLVHPGLVEACDGVDTDCDGELLAGETDGDGDGSLGCDDCDDADPDRERLDIDGDGVTTCAGDCDDEAAPVHPFAADLAGDALDTNCDDVDGIDADGDGWAGTSSGGADCDDLDPAVTPETDADGDGSTACGGDCDDADPTRAPSLFELCATGVDEDCDGVVDLDADLDGDGYDPCTGDCDEASVVTHPGAFDSWGDALGLDTDCDGVDGTDLDGDGYPGDAPESAEEYDCDDGDPLISPFDGDGDGLDPCAGDCDDADPFRYAGAEEEACDGIDSDCVEDPEEQDGDGDGELACADDCDDADAALNTADLDGDGYSTCGPDGGAETGDEDCDDADPTRYPGAAEACDGADSDCIGAAQEEDADGDGWVPCAPWVGAAPEILGGGDCDDDDPSVDPADLDGDGLSSCDGDCDEGDPAVYPGAPDSSCDGVDSDCVPDAAELDDDGDGVTPCDGDCDDGNADVYPGAPELCDGLDNDCNGSIAFTEYDDDGDSFGECAGDCDDGAVEVYPGAPELCNELDDDCDGLTEVEEAVDLDGDGFTVCQGDCDDLDPGRWAGNPAWEELQLGLDEDCSGYGGNSLEWAHARILGLTPGSSTARPLGSYPDLDGDGLDELLVGVPNSDPLDYREGTIYVVLGAELAAGGDVSLADAHARLIGVAREDQAGFAATALADLDGDGLPELAVSSVAADDGGSSSGTVYVVLGSALAGGGDILLASAFARLIGEDVNDNAGTQLLAVGDLDGGGLEDLLVSAPWNDAASSNAGAVYLVLGETLAGGGDHDLADAHATLWGELPGDTVGGALSPAGDIDGDGLDDLAIGAWSSDAAGHDAGAVYLVLASDLVAGGEWSLAAAHGRLLGAWTSDLTGESVAAVGDLDGDGLTDLLVGARGNDVGANNAGLVYLVLGSSLTAGGDVDLDTAFARFVGGSEGGGVGRAVLGPGDVDGDGLPDLVMTAPFEDLPAQSAGAAWLVPGSVALVGGAFDLEDTAYRFAGEGGGDNAGIFLLGPGDVDGDGLDDFLVGSPGLDASGENAGGVHLVLGQL